MEEDVIKINITRKDKIYLSIIAVLVLACVCLAIVLPRPYKLVEVEKPVYETVYQKVYDTKNLYLINPTSALYDETSGYTDAFGNEYAPSYENSYLDTGNLRGANVSVKVLEGSSGIVKTIALEESIANLIVLNSSFNEFGVNIYFDTSILNSINNIFIEALQDKKSNPLDYYLFVIEFERAVMNFVVCYISE